MHLGQRAAAAHLERLINDHLIRAPGLPFGGWKQSGFCREAAAQTLDEFSQTKSVFFDRTGMVRKPRYNILYPG